MSAARARSPEFPPVVRRLAAASLFQDIASEMVYPLLPGFLAALGGGPALLGAMESAADGVVAFVKGWAGKASDRAGKRKPFVVAGYAGSALARPLLALVTMPFQVVLLRIWDRLAKGVRSAPRDALIGEAVGAERRAGAFAYDRGLDHLGAAIGPLVAAALVAGGASLRSVFTAATIPALIAVATIAFGLSEHSRRRDSGAPSGALSNAAPSSTPIQRAKASDVAAEPMRLAPAAFLAAFLFGLANASDAFLLLRAGELGVPAGGLALLWSGMHVVRWLAATPGGRLADRLGARTALSLGWIGYGAVYLGMGLASSLGPWLAIVALYGAQAGFTEGSERAFAAGLAGRDAANGDVRLGTALGAWQRAAGFGALGASLVFGVLWESVSSAAAFAAAAFAALLAAAALRLVPSAQR